MFEIGEARAVLDAEFLEGEIAAVRGIADEVDQRPVAGQAPGSGQHASKPQRG